MTYRTNEGEYNTVKVHKVIIIYRLCVCNGILCKNHRWRCPDSSCRKTRSLRDNSFLEKSKLSLQKCLVLLHWWCRGYPVTNAAEEAQVTETTAIQAYRYLRNIYSQLGHTIPGKNLARSLRDAQSIGGDWRDLAIHC